MRHHIYWILFLACLACLLGTTAEPVATTAAVGDYQSAWLELEKGGLSIEDKKVAPIDVPLYLGLRDGKAVVAWFAHPAMSGGRIVWLDKSTLALEGGKLTRELIGRTCMNWGNKNVHDYVYTIDATVSSGAIAGTFSASFVDDADIKTSITGKLTGSLTTGEQSRRDLALPAGKNWPHYYGQGHGFSGPDSGAKMIDDLSLARPLWKSEAFVPTGYGSAPDSRYYDRAALTDNGGGSSSPLVVDGRVYQFFYYPRGPIGLDKAYGKYETEADMIAKAAAMFPKREIQQRQVVNHFRVEADEILVCLDAATGQTLWKTTLPQRGNNYQTHKHRGHFPVAMIADGTVYQPGITGRLYAIDAATGKLKWEYPEANPQPYVTKQGSIDCTAPSPVRVGDDVIYAMGKGVTAVDAKTGAKKWSQNVWHRGSLLPWKSADKTLVIATDRNHEKKENYAIALDPADGKIVWRQPVEYLMDFGFPLLAGDVLLGYSTLKENVKPGENDGIAVVHAYRVSAKGLEKAWSTPGLAPTIDTVGLAVHGEYVYVSAAATTFCLKLATGEVAAKVDNVGGARTQTAFVADGRLFIQPEGRHGKQAFFMLDAEPKNFRVLGRELTTKGAGHSVGGQWQWLPPHSWTTAYANQPINYPLVDGRLFVRGLDAIYCYDLRKK